MSPEDIARNVWVQAVGAPTSEQEKFDRSLKWMQENIKPITEDDLVRLASLIEIPAKEEQ